ncbi:uncharacterized protein CC84DRAFT_1083219 [Paraphaeosphaeria sporulosa]|uniref:Uncharacterized protein n=1 Tax=Paraphaeosphaeria sporulosa TaxID=1460663 RepID=A0A177CR29_9PLEO|nr:uncharacterized protein CC84DRAFT_1083219 [Paraphaeosphaeria sporulosa]OAG09418.1 hypothetical protein CC84DRAFT_1083219 [Paraphaeosphaeria sporulosa]
MFKPLSTAYSEELSAYLHRSQGLASITKGDFFPLFWNAWNTSFKESTILSSFKSTGISPLDPSPILDRFTQDQEESGDSSLSRLNDHDWRKLDRLVRSAAKDQSSRDTQKLRLSLHHLSVQNELLHHEIDGLRQALSIMEQEDNEEQLQKAETAELKKAAKLCKEKIRQERRAARDAAREAKEKERAEKAAQRAAQQSTRNAEKALQSSQKGKRKISQLSLQTRKRHKCAGDALAIREASEGASAAQTKTTRHGRNVKLPDRYQ